jgi:hypothetical protein
MAAPDLSDINNFMATRPNLFHKNIYARRFRTDPFVSMFPKQEYDLEEGRVPTVITSTHELPTAYPFNLTKVSLSNGAGDPACDVPATIVKSGHKTRSFQLEQQAFQSEVICLTDLQFKFQAVQQVNNKERGLSEFATVFMSDWHRVQNIGMINRKASTTGATSISEKSDALYDFSTLALPTFELNWVHLNALYDMSIRLGAGEFAVGQAMGAPTFALTLGPGYKRALFQDEEDVRETINFSNDSKLNFAARGITMAVNGFAPNVDEFPMRFAADGVTPIYPTTNENQTVGTGNEFNPDYRTVENGGLAVYEVVTILPRSVYEVHVRPVGPTNFGQEKFSATNYSGSVNWINNKDMDKNPLGNKGFYRIDFQMAAKPIYPELGYSILTLAKD